MVVVGALAGHATALAAHFLKGKPGRTMLLSVTKEDGTNYYFGDGLNRFLAPEDPTIPSLWGLIAPAAIEAGVPPAELPEPGSMFGYVTQSIGTGEFGKVRAPGDHPPHWSPRECLDAFWPLAREVLASTRSPMGEKPSVPVEHWPVVVALVARQFIGMTRSVLDPRLSLQFLMESAIAMSKVDPKAIPQERPKAEPAAS